MSIALVTLFPFFMGMVIVVIWKDLFQNNKKIPIYEFISVLGIMIIFGFVLSAALIFILNIAIKLEKDKLKKEKLEKHENNIAIALVTFSVTGCIFFLIFKVLSTQKSEN